VLPAALVPLAEDPGRSAILLDVDGVLAPIAARPELAAVPETTRRELRRLAGRYLLVACLSGRSGEDARRLVGVPEVEGVGNHGLELEPAATDLAPRVAGFRSSIGLPVEDKVLSLAYHYREATDEAAALDELERVAERAREAGLVPRWGRKVLEIRPPVDADKGTATRTLLARAGASRALYAGDDATDLDAFAGLGAAGLETAVRIAVASPVSPPALVAAADLVVESPESFAAILRDL
jgi:trehalose 6-phosphate phosphatase